MKLYELIKIHFKKIKYYLIKNHSNPKYCNNELLKEVDYENEVLPKNTKRIIIKIP